MPILQCPRLQEPKSMTPEQQDTFLRDETLVMLFEKECIKKDATISNEWRERLIVHLFNLSENPYPDNEKYTHYFNEMNELKQLIHQKEDIVDKVQNENLEQKAGMGYNYDFEYTATLTDGTELKRKYEYKHHDYKSLPQFLSLFDANNPATNEKVTEGTNAGKLKTKYMCGKPSFVDENKKPLEFWEGNPYWKYHFENGIPRIRETIPELPIISERAYFCHVKKLAVPGVSSDFPVTYSQKQLQDLTDEEIQEIADSKGIVLEDMKGKIDKHLKEYESWNKDMTNKGEHEEPEDIINFFHLLSDNQQNPDIKDLIQGNTTIREYLTRFMSEKQREQDLIEAVRHREENKRFIFFDKVLRKWYLGFFKDNFNFNEESHLEWDTTSSKLYLQTLENNYIEFNLRWANKLGIQNTAWQINIKHPDRKKKLDFSTIGYTIPEKKTKAPVAIKKETTKKKKGGKKTRKQGRGDGSKKNKRSKKRSKK